MKLPSAETVRYTTTFSKPTGWATNAPVCDFEPDGAYYDLAAEAPVFGRAEFNYGILTEAQLPSFTVHSVPGTVGARDRTRSPLKPPADHNLATFAYGRQAGDGNVLAVDGGGAFGVVDAWGGSPESRIRDLPTSTYPARRP